MQSPIHFNGACAGFTALGVLSTAFRPLPCREIPVPQPMLIHHMYIMAPLLKANLNCSQHHIHDCTLPQRQAFCFFTDDVVLKKNANVGRYRKKHLGSMITSLLSPTESPTKRCFSLAAANRRQSLPDVELQRNTQSGSLSSGRWVFTPLLKRRILCLGGKINRGRKRSCLPGTVHL